MSDEEIKKQEEELKRLQEEMEREEEELNREEEEIKRIEDEMAKEEEAIRLEEERLKREEEEEERKIREEEERIEKEMEELKKAEEEERLREEEAKRLLDEKKEEEERIQKEKEEAEKKAKEEAERLRKEAEKKANEERIQKEKEEAEKKAQEEELKRLEQERRRKEEEEERINKEREEAEKRAQEEKKREEERLEEERIQREKEEEQKRLEEERLKKEREEAEKRAQEEELKRKEEERIKKEKEESTQKEKEEAEKKAKEEAGRLKKEKEEAEKKAKEEAEGLRKEAEKKANEERIQKEKEEAEKKAQEERIKKIEEERIQREKEEQLRKQAEEEKKIREEEARIKMEAEEEERRIQEEEEKLRKEEEALRLEEEGILKEEKGEGFIALDDEIKEDSGVNIDALTEGVIANPVIIKRAKARGKTHIGKAGIYGNLKKEDLKTEYIEKEVVAEPQEQGKGFSISIAPGNKLPTKMNPLMAEMQSRKAKVGRASFSVKPSIITNPEKKYSPSTSPGVNDDPFLANQTFVTEIDGMNTTMNYEKMVRVSGKFYMKWRVMEIKPEALNSGDVFLIDKVEKIYVWIGKDCARLKRTKACDAANTIKHDERQGRCEIVQVLQGKEDEEFWKVLGGKNENVTKADAKQDDNEDKECTDELYLLGEKKDNWDEAEIVNCTKGKMAHSILLPWKVYVYDAGNEVYLWIGSKASQTLRKSAKTVAQEIFDKKERSPIAQLLRITQQTEPVIFKEKFAITQGTVETIHNPECSYSEDELNQKKEKTSGVSSTLPAKPSITPVVSKWSKKVEEEKMVIDIREMLGIPDDSIVLQPSKDFIIQGGTAKVFIVVEAQKEAIPEDMFGEFYSENDYIIDYKDPKEEIKFFYWQGKDTSIKSRGKTSVLVSNLSKQKGASTIRVPQGEEPHAFMQLFEDKYLIHIGNYFEKTKHQQSERIYQVSNTMFENTCEYTVQRELDKELINSSCSYIYVNKGGVKIWKGKYANEQNRKVAEEASKRIDPRPATVLDEKDGKVLFEGVSHFDLNYSVVMPKAFHLVLENLHLKAKQSHFFTYQRFKEPTILTCEKGIYLMVARLKKDCIMPYLETLHDYIEKLNGKYCGQEIPKAYVIHSIKHIPKEVASILHGFEKVSLSGCDIEKDPNEIIGFGELWEIINKKYPYEELLKRPTYLDKTKLESYLTDEEFEKIFKITREDYLKKKPFERDVLRKEQKLF